jgi:hypothetical protein
MLHPARVHIVESIRRAGRPLSAADLVDRMGSQSSAFTECHLRRLRRLGVILPSGPGGSDRHALAQRYRLAEEPQA